LITDTTPAASEPENVDQAVTEEEPPARFVVRLSPTEEKPARFHERKAAEAYADGYGLFPHAVRDSWATGETLPPWLAQAEAELAAERAESDRMDEEFALELAKEVNKHLAKVGITPVTPASTDGSGRLIPALLAPADPEHEFHGVHASFDEETGRVYLLTEDHESPGYGYTGLQLSVEYLDTVRDVLRARRNGPKPTPAEAQQPSADTEALVTALDEVRAALVDIAKRLDRP
jgi:hypothetical protein